MMQAPPPTHDSMPTATLAELLRTVCGVIDAPDPQLLTAVQAIARPLTDEQRGLLDDLLRAFARGVEQQNTIDEQAHWRRVLGQLPGLAPALEVLAEHV